MRKKKSIWDVLVCPCSFVYTPTLKSSLRRAHAVATNTKNWVLPLSGTFHCISPCLTWPTTHTHTHTHTHRSTLTSAARQRNSPHRCFCFRYIFHNYACELHSIHSDASQRVTHSNSHDGPPMLHICTLHPHSNRKKEKVGPEGCAISLLPRCLQSNCSAGSSEP